MAQAQNSAIDPVKKTTSRSVIGLIVVILAQLASVIQGFFLPTKTRLHVQRKTKYFSMYDIEDIDFDKIANNFEISGGSILNVLRYCAIQAANRSNGKVLEKDVIDAIKKEYDKEGQTI